MVVESAQSIFLRIEQIPRNFVAYVFHVDHFNGDLVAVSIVGAYVDPGSYLCILIPSPPCPACQSFETKSS